MAATVQIRRLTAAGAGTSTDVTSACIHAGTQDSNTSPCAIRIPSSGSNYSFWVNTQLNCTAAPDNALTNVYWYSDGTNSFGTGVEAVVATACTYTQAAGTAGSSGCVLNITNYPDLCSGGASRLFLYTSSCKLTVAGSTTTTGSFADRVVFQLQVESTAGAGNTAEETFTWQWDES